MLVVLTACAVPFLAAATGCTLKATFKQTTDTTSNITGTTSGRPWFTEEGQLMPGAKVAAFVSVNEDNLRQDVAQGRGEYLASAATLLDVPAERRADFSAGAQERYARVMSDGTNSAADLLSLLRHAASRLPAR